MLYPDGLMVVYDDIIYRVQRKNLLPLLSFDAAMSWGQPILMADDEVIENNYEISKQKLGFRPGSVISSKDGDVYYIEGVSKRQVTKYAYRQLGFNDYDKVTVSDTELMFHPTGDQIG